MNAIAMETTYESTPALADTLTKEEMEAVVMAAAEAEGGSQARREFRQLLNSKWREDVIAWCSISYRPIVRGLILSISAKSGEDGPDAIKLATEARMADLIKNLTPPDACALEKLLVERVAVTHLSLLVSEFRSANMLDDLATTEMRSRQVDRAQNRFFQAVRALASFRKVDPPALMLNVQAIGQQAIVTNPSPESRTRNVGCH